MHAIPPGVVPGDLQVTGDILRANRPIDLSAVEPGARGPVDEPASSDGTGKTGH